MQLVFPYDGDSFYKSLHGRFPETVFYGVCSFRVVRVHPRIKVSLQLFDSCIDSLFECDSVELILHGCSVKSLADTVCLRAFRLDFWNGLYPPRPVFDIH